MTGSQSVTAINLIRVRPGIEQARFEEFSRTVDQPACLAHAVVRGIEVFAIERADDAAIDIDFVELIHLGSWEEWVRVRDSDPGLAEVGRRFAALAVPADVTTVIGRRVAPSELPS